MIEANIKTLSVEKIMKKIKEEVNIRKASVSTADTTSSCYNIKNNSIDILQNKQAPCEVKEVYDYSDFTIYHDEEFVRNIYKAFLKREPDIAGLNHYLQLLRSGQRTKSEIITSLRFSDEGKKHNVKLLGARKRYLSYVISKVPFMGKVYKIALALLTLDKKMQNIYEYEAYTNRRYIELKKELISVQSAINGSNDKNILQINDKLSKVANELNINLSIENIHRLENELNQKVDKAELERITQELKDKVHENTLIEVQKDMDLKLENKVNINRTVLEESLEFCADDFLSSAINKFNYPITEFDRFDKEELYYSLLENVFYDSKVVKEKQKTYLKYIPKHNAKTLKHLDIGCGRGEFLLNLNERNFYAKGIDINSIEVETLLNNEFDVEHIDLIEYLSETDYIFSSISALQVVEHLEYDILKKFIKLAYSKISKNGTIILETINPHTSLAFNSFYMDETHKRPLPPEMLAFLLQWVGFKNIKFVFTSLLPQEYRSNDQRKNYHDYAVIGYKK